MGQGTDGQDNMGENRTEQEEILASSGRNPLLKFAVAPVTTGLPLSSLGLPYSIRDCIFSMFCEKTLEQHLEH